MFAIWLQSGQEKRINDWAVENKYTVVSIEKPWFSTGPFYTNDHQTIYKVTLRNFYEKEYIVWFRLPKGILQDEWLWDKEKHP